MGQYLTGTNDIKVNVNNIEYTIRIPITIGHLIVNVVCLNPKFDTLLENDVIIDGKSLYNYDLNGACDISMLGKNIDIVKFKDESFKLEANEKLLEFLVHNLY